MQGASKKNSKQNPANMQDRANVGHQLAGLAKRRQICPTLCQCCQCFANISANAVIIVVVSFLEFFHDFVMILGHFLLLKAFQFAKNTFFLLRFSQRW